MAKKVLKWTGPEEVVSQDLADAGHGLTVEPGHEYELDAELADALLAGSAGWVLVERKGKGAE